jgi:hypothetical protein
MTRNRFETKSAPRAELDQRARDARLRLERVGRLYMPHPVRTHVWVRWLICIFSAQPYTIAPQKNRAGKPLNDQRPSPIGLFCAYAPHEKDEWFSARAESA